MPTPKVPSFLKNTFEMITQVTESNPEIARWEEGGKTFIVYDRDRLAKEVIPNYFKHNQYSSFMRSLNSYRFTKEPMEVDGNLWHRYSHNGFVRGKPELLPFVHQSLPSHANKVTALPETKRTIDDLLTENENLTRRVRELEAELRHYRSNGNYGAASTQSASFIPETRFHSMKTVLDMKKRKATDAEIDAAGIIKKMAGKPPSILRISSSSGQQYMDFKPIPLTKAGANASHSATPSGSVEANSYIHNDPTRRITRRQSRQLSMLNNNKPSGPIRIASISFSNTDEVHVLPGPRQTNPRLQKPKPLFFPTQSQDHLFLELMHDGTLNAHNDDSDCSGSI
eukprot:CAMPEP_0196820410 /NCGR_PEP_ID=MMETSP1362-20130617/75167_1 /TAXON_ID=163516 /ORGANISM="Leptocylindrus danicus, Strain CCMP1856" /LENGTH=339 /DNA_ID=CAMNT_0042199285 /DNA_START=89 /DNA_END=1108 /DNA_ORIENTATION=+